MPRCLIKQRPLRGGETTRPQVKAEAALRAHKVKGHLEFPGSAEHPPGASTSGLRSIPARPLLPRALTLVEQHCQTEMNFLLVIQPWARSFRLHETTFLCLCYRRNLNDCHTFPELVSSYSFPFSSTALAFSKSHLLPFFFLL